MAAPRYMAERRYSYHVAPRRVPSTQTFQVETPETAFEQQVHGLFFEAEEHLHHGEHGLALAAYEELQLLILRTVHPTMPVDPKLVPKGLDFDLGVLDPLVQHVGTMLQNTSLSRYAFPASLIAPRSTLSPGTQKALQPLVEQGLVGTSFHDSVLETLGLAAEAALDERFDAALKLYDDALRAAGDGDPLVRGTLLHDMALLADKADQHAQAAKLGQESLDALEQAENVEAQVRALDTMTGVFLRAGDEARSKAAATQAQKLGAAHNLDPIVVPRTPVLTGIGIGAAPIARVPGGPPLPGAPRIRRFTGPAADADEGNGHGNGHEAAEAVAAASETGSVLLAADYIAAADATRTFVVQGEQERVELNLSANGSQALLDAIAQTNDIGILTGYLASPAQMVAYLPHMYFFVIPMAIGDCLAALGNLTEAEAKYRGVLAYPFINQRIEAVRLWTRLADVYLRMGDLAYRAARDNVAGFTAARAHYERIVRSDGTIDPGSPLYADAGLAGVRARVESFLGDGARGDNPELLTRVLTARTMLGQIAAGLNYFGIAPDYLPPFSFEYLQTTARYFAQSASQIEQRYILFKSTAENEELRREQLDQQAEVAAQAVVLEQRGLDEAQAGIDVAEASVEYADVQHDNAVEALDDFEDVRWELLELATLEAWGNATSVHTNDQIKFDIDWTYYQSEDKPRNQVLQDLAHQRTLISHDLEEERLERAIAAAEAAKGVAEAQLGQAQARAEVAEQRLEIAQLQQTFAEENRDFLDLREFSARLWYDLAAQAQALTRRYQDQAIEIALLAERAYNAETERGLHLIRFDYTDAGVGELLGADRLLADIDAFTADLVTTVTTKKLPMKQVISIADNYPIAYHQLRSTGRCMFPTELADFDRAHPGMHLCKIRNVELVLVGITGATSIAGTLRTVGVSRFRRADGSIVTRSYPSDVMPISQYSVRNDALVFRFNPNDLRVFELGGIDALWQLELPQGANQFALGDLLDVQLCLYYDGFFSPALETAVKASLPTSGAGSRGISLGMELPDELFYLKSNGDAELAFTELMFPRNQRDRVRTNVALQLAGAPAAVGGVVLRLASEEHGAELVLTTGPNGAVDDTTAGQPLRALRGEPLLDRWTVRITAEDNPGLVRDGAVDLGGVRDVLVFLEYDFDYR